MKFKIVESSLNLRIEREKKNSDYVLLKNIADKQLLFKADVYCNVEYMKCQDAEYLMEFANAGYTGFTSLDKHNRGILCEIKNDFHAEKIHEMSNPHMLHLRVNKDDAIIDLIIVRILVSSSSIADFKDRQMQWQKVINYITGLGSSAHIVLTGDFNHGVIRRTYRRDLPRYYYNYQMIVGDLKKMNIDLFEIEGTSYMGYMKIDHIATGKQIHVRCAEYKEIFDPPYPIGIPDHSFIIAECECS